MVPAGVPGDGRRADAGALVRGARVPGSAAGDQGASEGVPEGAYAGVLQRGGDRGHDGSRQLAVGGGDPVREDDDEHRGGGGDGGRPVVRGGPRAGAQAGSPWAPGGAGAVG